MAKTNKPKTAKVSLLRRRDNAMKFATDTADSVAQWGAGSVTGARKAVQARPLTTALLSLSAGAVLGALIALCGFRTDKGRWF
jgi:hypothetical protein